MYKKQKFHTYNVYMYTYIVRDKLLASPQHVSPSYPQPSQCHANSTAVCRCRYIHTFPLLSPISPASSTYPAHVQSLYLTTPAVPQITTFRNNSYTTPSLAQISIYTPPNLFSDVYDLQCNNGGVNTVCAYCTQPRINSEPPRLHAICLCSKEPISPRLASSTPHIIISRLTSFQKSVNKFVGKAPRDCLVATSQSQRLASAKISALHMCIQRPPVYQFGLRKYMYKLMVSQFTSTLMLGLG